MYQAWCLEPIRYLQPCLNGNIFENHKLMNLELDMLFSNHAAKHIHVLMNGITVLQWLALCGSQGQDFLAKYLSEATTDWSIVKIRQMAKMLESSEATVKHVRSMPTSQPQAQVSQWGIRGLITTNTERRAKTGNLHP